jgi:serine/threonine-protein kinase HipA
MSVEVHIDWQGETRLVGRLHTADRGSSVSFEYAAEWLQRDDAFAIDPTSLSLQRTPQHAASVFGAIQDCGPDRWGRVLIERAVRKKVLPQKPYHEMDYVLALDDASRIGVLRFRFDTASSFLAASSGKLPPLVRLSALLRATDAIHNETETAQDLRFLLGAGSPLGGARPKSAVALADDRLAIAKFSSPFLPGARLEGNCTSRLRPWMPTPARLTIRSWMKPEIWLANSSCCARKKIHFLHENQRRGDTKVIRIRFLE